MTFTQDELLNVPRVLSAPRFATYLQECENDKEKALEIYKWNLEISAAFVVPLHVLEVAIRNAVVEALEKVHTPNWPWNQGFLISLPDPPNAYSPRRNLREIASRQPTTGKVVAELDFVFWQKMFTYTHDVKIWNANLKVVFPNAPQSVSIIQLRKIIHDDIFNSRKLRNRIAHHEPIFSRNLQNDYDKIRKLISWRDIITESWMHNIEQVLNILQRRP